MGQQRPLIVGPDKVEMPYPVIIDTEVISGFGRGSSELGIPTANIPPDPLSELDPGVYYGWVRVFPRSAEPETKHIQDRDIVFNYGSKLRAEDLAVFPMVMSIGWNPFFKNIRKSVEIHVMHDFASSFYGSGIKVCVTGFIRNEQSYESIEDLIADINTDIQVARNSLARPDYEKLKSLL